MKLRLLRLSFERVELLAYADPCDEHDGWERLVTVDVHAGASWFAAVRFPHSRSDTGESLGDPDLDAQIRERAAEELVRLEAATAIATGRRAA